MNRYIILFDTLIAKSNAHNQVEIYFKNGQNTVLKQQRKYTIHLYFRLQKYLKNYCFKKKFIKQCSVCFFINVKNKLIN